MSRVFRNKLFGSLKSVLNLQVTLNYPDEKICNHLTTIMFLVDHRGCEKGETGNGNHVM